MKRLSIILLSMPCIINALIPLQYDDKGICTVQPSSGENAVSPQELQEIKKLIQRVPLQYLKIGDECRRVYAKYVSLKVTGGPFSGNNLEILLVKGKVFQRMRVCDSCPFSPWHLVQRYPFDGKKNEEFFICSDGTIKVYQKGR